MSTTPKPETDAIGEMIRVELAAFKENNRQLIASNNAAVAERDEARRELAEAKNEIARLNGQTRWLCQCGGTLAELESLRRDKARLDWIFSTINMVGTRGFTDRVSWRFPGITREDIDAAMEGTP